MAQSLRFTFAVALVLYLGMLLTSSEASHRQDLQKGNANKTSLNNTKIIHLLYKTGYGTPDEHTVSAYCNPDEDLENINSYSTTELLVGQERIVDDHDGVLHKEKNYFIALTQFEIKPNSTKNDDAHRQ